MLGRPVPSRNVTAKWRMREGARRNECPQGCAAQDANPGTELRRMMPG